MPSVHLAKLDNEKMQHRQSQEPDRSSLSPTHQVGPRIGAPSLELQRAQNQANLLTARDVLALQRRVGNRAVAQLLDKPARSTPGIQAKSNIGAAHDSFEQEADRVAEQVTSGATPAPTTIQRAPVVHVSHAALPPIQRKTMDLHIDERLTSKYHRVGYSKSVEAPLKVLVAEMKMYNAIPLNDKNYDGHLTLLKSIKKKARKLLYKIDDFRGFLNKKGTWRSLGGPFRMQYGHLMRKLARIAGGSLEYPEYVGEVEHEIDNVYGQKGVKSPYQKYREDVAAYKAGGRKGIAPDRPDDDDYGYGSS